MKTETPEDEMGWKALKYVFVPAGGPVRPVRLIAMIPAEVVLGFIDLRAEERKRDSSISSLRTVNANIPLLYEPATTADWYALIALCQKLAAADSMRAALVGREYVKVKMENSIIRIRVSRTIAPLEAHPNQQMYYVSYDGEYNPATSAIVQGAVNHSFTAQGAAFPPTYPAVAQFFLNHPAGNDAAALRRCLKGNGDAGRTEVKTAAVATFLAEGARNVRAVPINLMMLDLVEESVPYTTTGGRLRTFSIDRMFWRRHEFSARPAAQTAGGHMPQSGAGGADTKRVKMIEPVPGGAPAHWSHRTVFAPHPAQPMPPLNPLQNPQFVASHTFAAAHASVSAMAGRALDKECGVVCAWLAHKFSLLAEERLPNMAIPTVQFLPITNLNAISLAAAPAGEEAQVASLHRKLQMINGALTDRCDSLDNLAAVRTDIG